MTKGIKGSWVRKPSVSAFGAHETKRKTNGVIIPTLPYNKGGTPGKGRRVRTYY
jgi:hypothetical protein